MELRRATKSQSKLRIGMAGTSGSGKTYSSLLMASGMTSWDKIAIIDTENGSADLYSNLGPYNVITLTAPFSPERYIEAIKTCEQAGMEVIIIDSITHEWDGTGGILQIHEQLGGNSFTAWGKLTPRHNAFIQAILQSPAHIITTVRRKQDYAMETVDGKVKVQKQGLKEVTREGFEYELTLSFALAQNHLAVASKDRTGLFMDRPEFVISSETGKQLIAWANSGTPAKFAPTMPAMVQEDIRPDEYSRAQIKDVIASDTAAIGTETITRQEPTKKEITKETLQAQAERVKPLLTKNADAPAEIPCPLHTKQDGSPMMMKYRPARDVYSHARKDGANWEYCQGKGFPGEEVLNNKQTESLVDQASNDIPF